MTRLAALNCRHSRTAALAAWLMVAASAFGQSFRAPTKEPVNSPLASPPSARPANETVVWGQEVFAIPYQWGGETDPSLAKQVVLHLSLDRGSTWQQVSTAEPRVQSFTYRAPRDGEYWFAVRTVDTTGRAWPAGPLTPELHVVVDTQIPAISALAATIAPGGQLRINCVVQDANPDAKAISISVQTGGGWRAVPATAVPGADGRSLIVSGSTPLGPGVQQAAVRVDAKDQAGNPAGAGVLAVARALPPATPSIQSPTPSVSQRVPLNFGTTPYARSVRKSTRQDAPRRDPFLGQTPIFAAPQRKVPALPVLADLSDPRAQPPALPNTPSTTSSGWHSSGAHDRLAAVPHRDRLTPTRDSWTPDGIARVPFRGEARPLTPVEPSTPRLSSQTTTPRGAPNPPGEVYRSPGVPGAFASLGPTPPPASIAPPTLNNRLSTAPPAFRTTPLPEQAQFVGTSRFELDYDVESAGRWGVSKVTLWGTRDRGQTWRSFAVDSDNRSPIDVSVDAEGLYGFRITVEGVGGLAPVGPQPGDAPEVWVEVDQTRPEVRLTAAQQGEGYFGDHLIVQWQADDANLAPRPITLSYASRPGGPWAPMASSIENTGRYAWRLQRHLPGRLYLRVEVQDMAGNTGSTTTPQPLSIDLPTPTATFLNVRPIEG